MMVNLAITGVIGAVAAILLGGVFGQSTRGGYLWRGSWTTKETSYVLKGMKIIAAGAIATFAGTILIGMAPWIIALVLLSGIVLVLHAEIDNWKLF